MPGILLRNSHALVLFYHPYIVDEVRKVKCLSPLGLLKQKYHTLGGLNNKYLFFTVLEAGSSKIKVSADFARSES